MGERLSRARAFVREELWEAEPEPRSTAAWALAVLQFSVMIGQGFVRDQLLLRASALTYFTVLSIVPLLAIMIAVADAVGVTGNFAGMVVDHIAAGSPEAREKILALVERANFGALGSIGAATLFLTTVLGIGNIERSFNKIWGVKQVRSLGRRLPDYLAVLVIAPVLAGSGLSLATTLKSELAVQKLMDLPGFAPLYTYGLKQLPAVVLSLAFAFLVWFLPNTKVRASAALLGGFVAGFLVVIAQDVYLGMSFGVSRANVLYGSFAQIPLLFVWIYFFWAIVLFGAEVAFAYQNLDLYRREVRGEPTEQPADLREHLGQSEARLGVGTGCAALEIDQLLQLAGAAPLDRRPDRRERLGHEWLQLDLTTIPGDEDRPAHGLRAAALEVLPHDEGSRVMRDECVSQTVRHLRGDRVVSAARVGR